jgi:hypothetical protein
MNYTVCTTFNAAGYEKYGQRMIQTFLQNWPQEVRLIVYAEGCIVNESAPNLTVYNLEVVSPDLVAFKQQWKDVPKANGDVSRDPIRSRRRDAGKGFKWDAVRFAHKVYAIFHCARTVQYDWLLWMDADTICHSPITIEDIAGLCPDKKDLCFLGRRGKFSECGLYAMNLSSPATRLFLTAFQQAYDDAEDGIFKLEEWHDSFVFDAVRRRSKLAELDWSSHLITGEGHPLINSAWGAWLDHLKGARKNTGRSPASDLKVPRTEAYWQ